MKRIASVELLRFISAMMVIIWHYQQFYFPYNFFSDTEILITNRNEQPFYNYLSLFYNYGNKGVDLFFIISGYVFAYVYLIENKLVNLKSFFSNRFARLYPLHFLTLITVTILQFYSVENFDSFFIHPFNDAYHFLLNLFFISGWGFEKGPSFNGPIWRVSVEIIIYFLFFFLIINSKKNRILKSFLLVAFFIIFKKIFNDDFLKNINMNLINCGIIFFEGVLVYYLTNKIKDKKIIFFIGIFLLSISLIGNFKIYVFLPAILIIFLTLEYLIKGKIWNFFNFLGNLTYGTYLWHLPLQILVMIIIKETECDYSIIDYKIFFLGYIFILILVSIISFYFFEKKMRLLLKKKLKSEN